ncbi:sensor histidine kinase [Kitasatospora sp. NPDC096147]|uniref:sensor histidine kinase n=1 Tax=Kitasatospora sp. NPDC096147 TaxID=3364093 RepID=UPI0037FD643A
MTTPEVAAPVGAASGSAAAPTATPLGDPDGSPDGKPTVTRPSLLPAYAVFAVTLLGTLAWVLVALGSDSAELRAFATGYGAVQVVTGTGMALAGVLFATQHPAVGLGRLLLAGGAGAVLAEALPAVTAELLPGTPLFTLACGLALIGRTLFLLGLFALPLFLPGGRLPRRWGPPYLLLLTLLAAVQTGVGAAAFDPWYGQPLPLDGELLSRPYEWTLDWPYAVWLGDAVVGVNLLVMTVRWARSRGRQRVSGVAILLPYLLWIVVVLLGSLLGLGATTTELLWYLTAAGWPVATALSCVRDRSLHLDRPALRTLAGLLTATALITVYGLAVLLSYRLRPDGSTANGPLPVAVALLIGTLLRPTARRATRLVERYYYGDRSEPYQVVRGLSDRLGRAVSPAELPVLLCAAVVETLRLPGARVVTRTRDGERELAALGGFDPGTAVPFPMTHQDEEIGRLLVPPRPGQSALDRQDTDVLATLAAHAAPAIATLRLYEQLQASRERIVLAREEARRRLRHDLHDGLGPMLSGLRLRVDAIRATELPGGPGGPADRPLTEVSTGIGQAITELRHITDGLAPAALDRHGLGSALTTLVGRLAGAGPDLTLVLTPDPLPALPAAVEVAAYRICAEALHNAVRHARASRIRLALTVREGQVEAEVTDDGCGFTPPAAGRDGGGIGLRSMADRAEELGGRFSLTPAAAGGTAARAVLPLPSPSTPPGPSPCPDPPRADGPDPP